MAPDVGRRSRRDPAAWLGQDRLCRAGEGRCASGRREGAAISIAGFETFQRVAAPFPSRSPPALAGASTTRRAKPQSIAVNPAMMATRQRWSASSAGNCVFSTLPKHFQPGSDRSDRAATTANRTPGVRPPRAEDCTETAVEFPESHLMNKLEHIPVFRKQNVFSAKRTTLAQFPRRFAPGLRSPLPAFAKISPSASSSRCRMACLPD